LRFYPNPNFSPDFKGIDSIPSSTTLRYYYKIAIL